MKTNVFLFVTLISVLFISSCTTSDYKREYSGSGMVAKTNIASGEIYLFYVDDLAYPISHEILEKYNGKSLLVKFTVNYDSNENSGYSQRGYLVAEAFEVDREISTDNKVSYNNIDLETRQENEIAVSAVEPAGFVNDYLFTAITTRNVPKGSTIRYKLEINSNQEPSNSINGIHCYDMYLRVIVDKSDSNETQQISEYQGFNLDIALHSFRTKERAEKNQLFYLRINFVKEFDDDTIHWIPVNIANVYLVYEDDED